MKLKTPSFWYNAPSGFWFQVLKFLSRIYLIGYRINQSSQRTRSVDIPVICIGNAVVGGSGKTPSAIAVMELIKAQGLAKKPVFLTRGYGGDEDQLLSKYAPVIINADRYDGALEAQSKGADMIIMDDGFQNQGLFKDINFLVIDGYDGFGNAELLPAGPLREPLIDAINRANAFIIVGDDVTLIEKTLPPSKTCFHAKLIARDHSIDLSKPVLGFAGLGRPEKLKRTLERIGFDVRDFISYPDHYAYAQKDYDALIEKANSINAQLVTTEKDLIKLSAFDHKSRIKALPISLELEEPANLKKMIRNNL